VKVTIVGGGGGVGSSTAFNLLLRPEPYDVVLVDPRAAMVTSHAMDLEQVLELGGTGTIRGGDPADVTDADVLVVSASTALTVNASRVAYLQDNAAIILGVAEHLGAGWGGVIVVVTNPVDPLTTLLQQRTGLDRRRVLGYTLNDRLRLQTGVSKAHGTVPGSISAWVIGEHGDAFLPLFERLEVEGAPLELAVSERAAAAEFLRTWYVRHVSLDSGRSSTWTTGLGVARLVSALARDTLELCPVSIVLDGEYGIRGVALSVPATIGRAGAVEIHEWPLTREQQTVLERAAASVRGAVSSVRGVRSGARAESARPS
jgi:malate/lactate dehydrogenase